MLLFCVPLETQRRLFINIPHVGQVDHRFPLDDLDLSGQMYS